MWKKTGEGTVFSTLINGRDGYLARITIQNSTTGERITITGSGGTQRLALQRREKNLQKKLEKLVDAGEVIDASRTAKAPAKAKGAKGKDAGITVAEFLPTFIRAKGASVKPQTLRHYEKQLSQHFIPTLGDRRLDSITRLDLEIFAHTTLPAQYKLAPTTVFNEMKIVKNFFTAAENYGLIPENPGRGIKMKKPTPAVHDADKKWINQRAGILKGLLKEIGNPQHPDHEHYLLILLMGIGLRRAEILGLEWECITGLEKKNRCQIIIRQQLVQVRNRGGYMIQQGVKGSGSARSFYVPEVIRKALLKRKRENRGATVKTDWAENMIFITPRGHYLNYSAYANNWEHTLRHYLGKNGRTVKDSEIWRPHSNRKIAASLLAKEKVPMTIAASIMGHDETLYQYYAVSMEDARTEALQRLAGALGIEE